jgi:DtxR family Mn-dependent transcriptional regulator
VKRVNIKKTSISSHAEEYLEAIYRLERQRGFARTMELARKLKVVPGSVTNTIESLEERGLVIHKPYKGVRLTEKGRRLASTILRRHRLAERLLTDILHMDWSQVHKAACKLEHVLSPEIVRQLEKVLRHPKTCPHGNPIPTKCGGIFEEKTEALSELDAKMRGIIFKIVEEKTEVLRQLQNLGLTLGKNVEVEEKFPTGLLTVSLGDESLKLNRKLASIIYVKKIEEELKK